MHAILTSRKDILESPGLRKRVNSFSRACTPPWINVSLAILEQSIISVTWFCVNGLYTDRLSINTSWNLLYLLYCTVFIVRWHINRWEGSLESEFYGRISSVMGSLKIQWFIQESTSYLAKVSDERYIKRTARSHLVNWITQVDISLKRLD